MLVIRTAEDAPTAASTINQAAFNLGNAPGAGLASAALAGGLSYASLPLIAATLAAIALVFSALALARRGRAVPQPAA
jgi:DHA1 family inner membrane transport protein